MSVNFYDYQEDAIRRMHNGCILVGGVGSGKSRTSLGYFERAGGKRKLYIITTAKKRDSKEWEEELEPFEFDAVVDSWNNIKKYRDITGAFFIFRFWCLGEVVPQDREDKPMDNSVCDTR